MSKNYAARFYSIIVFLITISWSYSHAAIFQVTNSSQLHSAIANAQNNGLHDTIRIAQGNYTGNFIYSSHATGNLTIEGGWRHDFSSREINAQNTVLDGNLEGNVFVFSCDQPVNLKIDGITFQNGLIQTGEKGSGIFISIMGYDWVLENNSISIENNIIQNNFANVTTHALGIGIYIWTHADVVIRNNTIKGNQLTTESYEGSNISGGGVYLGTSETVDIINNTITKNEALNGGGLYLSTNYLHVRILGNTISENNAGANGGGLYASTGVIDTATIISGNIFSDNSSARYGGGMFLRAYGEKYTITNNLLTGNTSAWTGGGIFIQSDAFNRYQLIDLINNTIAYNQAGRNGGGLHSIMQEDKVTLNIYNNIFWKNSSDNPGYDMYLDNDYDGNYLAGVCNMYNNSFNQSGFGIYMGILFAIHSTNLNYKDPLFADPLRGNYKLSHGSPSLNKGNNNAPNLPSIDLSGKLRIQDGVVDMGAYEGTDTLVSKKPVLSHLILLLKSKY